MTFRKLTTRLLLVVLALFVVTGLLSVLALGLAVNGIIGKLGSNFALERAALERSRIGAILDREAVLARKLADSPPVVHWLLAEHDPALRAAAFEELDSFRRAFRDSNYFVVVDASKTYYTQPQVGPLALTTLHRDVPGDAWYFQTVAAGQPSTFNLDYNALIGQTKVWINCVVRADGRVVGVAGTGIDITDLISQLVSTEGSNVHTLLIDSNGAITAAQNRSVLEQNGKAGLTGRKVTVFDLAGSSRDRATLERLMTAAREGKSGVDVVNLQGKRSLTVIAPLPDIGWMTVVSVDASAAISLVDFLPLFAVVVLSLLAVLVAISFVMERVVLLPLGTMTASARRIASGDYNLAIPAERGDEIGALATAFNEMASQVKGYTERLESLVERRTAELTDSNRKLEIANTSVMESIRYAQLMQRGAMPPASLLTERLSGWTLFHRQRDVVGGDFLYFRDLPRGFLIAVIDCAGHGVPGALMTMVANSSLELITGRVPLDDPARMLEELDEAIRVSLRQRNGESLVHGGMDVGLCACLPDERTVVFCGAGMPLYVARADGATETIGGRRAGVGYHLRRHPGGFENRRIAMDGAAFVLVTDGFVDQAGGADGRAFGTRRLGELLARCAVELAPATPDWENAFDRYRGDRPQRDDVLVFGFTMSKARSLAGG